MSEWHRYRSGAGIAGAAASAGHEPTAGERWARWVAVGAAQDRRMNARMRYVALIGAAGLLAALALLMMTG